MASLAALSRATPRRADPDPVAWMEKLGVRLWSKQAEIARSVASKSVTVVQSSNSSGKTALAGMLAIWWPLRWGAGKGQVVITGPNWGTIADGVMKEAGRFHADHDLPGRVGQSRFHLPYRGKETLAALGRALAQTGRGAAGGLGQHAPHLLVIAEEAIGLSPTDYETLATWTAGGDASLLVLSNPRGSKRSPYGKMVAAYGAIKIGWEDMPACTGAEPDIPGLMTRDYYERQVAVHGEDSAFVAWSCRGEFPAVGSGGQFPADVIERAIRASWDEGSPVFGGLDAGGSGDPNVLYLLAGRRLRHRKLQTRASGDPAQVAAEVAAVCRLRGVRRLAVDAFGVGAKHAAALTAELSSDPTTVIPVLVGDKARSVQIGLTKQKVKNKKARAALVMSRDMRDGDLDIDPADDTLLEELEAVHPVNVESGVHQLESRDQFVARTGHSPDHFTAAYLTFVARDAGAPGVYVPD